MTAPSALSDGAGADAERRPVAHVLVLAGGLDYERDVSLKSGRRVVDALRHVGVQADLVEALEVIPEKIHRLGGVAGAEALHRRALHGQALLP